eukprot:TRINITY_DN6284_c0_g1_i1.p1 TRINITY_DN6284_c0_g1~~TRINITY_DN6284_c0_g1_i1.p1  ORF type:complete len:635 (+),score=98.78 TRINITY_DN6284_c0_g1_i1:48-1952(+)
MSHPLDPLSITEINVAVRAVKSSIEYKEHFVFNCVTLKEPPKQDVIEYEKSGKHPIRMAFICLIDPKNGRVYEVHIDLGTQKHLNWKEAPPQAQPTLTPDDCFLAEKIVKESVEVSEELKKRGIDISKVTADPWSVSYSGEKEWRNHRCVQLFLYTRNFDEDNHYAHPIDVLPVVDINSGKVIKIDTCSKVRSVPQTPSNYMAKFRPSLRNDLKPLYVQQPEGPSFKVEGNSVSWQKWNFRIGWNYREGLVLHRICYIDGDRNRPVVYRASLCEMAVPYGQPQYPFVRKVAFDVGDYGLGYCANSLALGCDCLGHIHYIDGVLANSKGEPYVIKNAICLHEEDHGVLWKHVEYRTGKSEVRRSRRLVVSFIATVVNYEYAFYWYFYQDGTLEFDIKATGELSTNDLGEEDEPKHGVLVMPGVNAQYHQHMFNARLDMSVDGFNNSVYEVDIKALPMEEKTNPYGNAFIAEDTLLTTEKNAKRVINSSTGRYWKITNPSITNSITKQPVAWTLHPKSSMLLLAHPDSWIAKRAQFATKSLWVTPYQPNENFPAGDYPNQSVGCEGISKWTQNDRNVTNTDIVLWHSFGLAHIPRPEDFPVMPVESTGFKLRPFGFFSENPSVDVPPSPEVKCCKE